MKHPNGALNSMTGFARSTGSWRDVAWVWELKSVNGKALDLRFRLPPGFDAIENAARANASTVLKRGNVQINLALQNSTAPHDIKINTAMLDQLVAAAEELRKKLGSPPIHAESLLGLRGVLDSGEAILSEDDAKQRDAAVLKSFEKAVIELASARQAEGARLTAVISAQLQRIEDLCAAAAANPSRGPEAIRKRLGEQVAKLLEQSDSFDQQRLHQEVVLLATRADIQEELDRLASHIIAARTLLQSPEPVGRKFDFLAQEFNREANTLCSKANDPTLTSIGLDLKTTIDQLREQVQNIE
jgi:uncharacterized protein (TIGR00255 family)